MRRRCSVRTRWLLTKITASMTLIPGTLRMRMRKWRRLTQWRLDGASTIPLAPNTVGGAAAGAPASPVGENVVKCE